MEASAPVRRGVNKKPEGGSIYIQYKYEHPWMLNLRNSKFLTSSADVLNTL